MGILHAVAVGEWHIGTTAVATFDKFGLEDQLQRIKSTHDTHLHVLELFGSQQSAECDWSRLRCQSTCAVVTASWKFVNSF